MKDYEELLKEIIDRYDPNKASNISKVELKGNTRLLIQELERLNLVRVVGNVGWLETLIEPTYDGIHYFDEQNESDSYISIPKASSKKYDVFLSHASKDKETYIEGLYRVLDKLGITIFYDKESIGWGDHWKEKIIEGTQESEFAIIVISKNFFGREWTEKELKRFLSQENESGQKMILPIIHGITNEELTKHYPEIGEIQAISSSDHSEEEIAILFAKAFIKRLKNLE